MMTSAENHPTWGSFFQIGDHRGTWTRTFDSEIFLGSGLKISQSSISINRQKGTLRGLHSLDKAAGEWKLVTCVSGEIWDVVVDLDPVSPGFGSYRAAKLTGKSADWVLIPPGFAHGFISLTNDAILSYSMTANYDSSAEIGYRFNDPTFGIIWPLEPVLVSDKDRALPIFAGRDD